MKEPVYIVDEMETVVAKVSTIIQASALARPVYYMYGHPSEVVNNLQEMTNEASLQNSKYPLIALFTDVPIRKGQSVGMYGDATVQVVICALSDRHYKAPQRMEETFKPILYPIYNEFLNQLRMHKQFNYLHEEEIRHTQIDRLYWGRQGLYGNQGNMFNDYIDCIELQSLVIPIENKICSFTNRIK